MEPLGLQALDPVLMYHSKPGLFVENKIFISVGRACCGDVLFRVGFSNDITSKSRASRCSHAGILVQIFSPVLKP